jgi:hypothetical protein
MTKAPKTVEELAPDPASTEVQSQAMPSRRPTDALTFGEKAVGLTFNPSGDPIVDELKREYAKIIDLCEMKRGSLMAGSGAHRLWSIAITEAQGAQMWAVKAATWKD